MDVIKFERTRILATVSLLSSPWLLRLTIWDLTIRQRRCQWNGLGVLWNFSPLYQVTQLLESEEVRLKLKRGDRVRVQREIVKFIALPFPFSSQLKIWSFYVVVVQGRQINAQKRVMHVQSYCFAQHLLFFKRSHHLGSTWGRKIPRKRKSSSALVWMMVSCCHSVHGKPYYSIHVLQHDNKGPGER